MKLNKGSVKFFQSRSSLEKTTAKLISRRTTCDRRAAHMRNEYLLCLAAANAHRKRLHETDMPYLMETLDGDIYERLRNHFRVFSTTEIETSTYVKSCFQKISDEAEMSQAAEDSQKIKRCHQQQKFLKENPIFTDIVQYVYDPVENDEVSNLIMDNTESLYLEREARRWATQVAKESNRIGTLTRQMEGCQPYLNQLRGSDNSSDSGFSQDKDPEVKLDTLRETRRKAETNKSKAEAKLDVMRNAGIDVEEWLNSAYEAMAKEAEIEAQTMLQQQHSQQEQQHSLVEQQHYETSHEEFDDGDDVDDDQRQHAPHVRELHSYSITSFDSVDEFEHSYDDQISQGSSGHSISSKNPTKCTAIFDYTAQRDDELTIREHDVLELIEESEGDGWLKARNQHGDTGYVPENYIEIEKQRLSFTLQSPKGDGGQQSGQELGHASSQSSVDYEVQAVMGVQGTGEDSGRPAICMVRALYDYAGGCHEELSFVEGTVFKLLRRDENGIDDGFWEGEINGRIGVFPSLLVEELDSESRQGSSDSKSKSRSRPKYRQHRCVPSIVIDDAHCWSNDSSYTYSSEDSYAERQIRPSPRSFFPGRAPPHSRRSQQRSSPKHPIAARKANRNSVVRSFKKGKKIEYKKAPKKGTPRVLAGLKQNGVSSREAQVQSKRQRKLVGPSRKSPSDPQCKECIQSARNRPPLPEPRRDPVERGTHNKWFRIQSTDDNVLKANGVQHPCAPPHNLQLSVGALDRTKSPSLNSNMNQCGGFIQYEVSAEQIKKSQTLTRAKSCWDCKEAQPCRCRPKSPLPDHTYYELQRPDQHRQQFQTQRHNQCTQDLHRQTPPGQAHHREDPRRKEHQRQDPSIQDLQMRSLQKQDPQRRDPRVASPQRQDFYKQDCNSKEPLRHDPQMQDLKKQNPQRQNHQIQERKDHGKDLPQCGMHIQELNRHNQRMQNAHRQDLQQRGMKVQELNRQNQLRQDPVRRDPQRQAMHMKEMNRLNQQRQEQLRHDLQGLDPHLQELNINHHRNTPCRTDPRTEHHVRTVQQRQNSNNQETVHQEDLCRAVHKKQEKRETNLHREGPHEQNKKRQDQTANCIVKRDQIKQNRIEKDQVVQDPFSTKQVINGETSQGQRRQGQHRQYQLNKEHNSQDSFGQDPTKQDDTEQDDCRNYVNGQDVQALGALKHKMQKQDIREQEFHPQSSEGVITLAVNGTTCKNGSEKETITHRDSTLGDDHQSEEDKALRKLRFLDSRKSLEQKFSAPILGQEDRVSACISGLKDKEASDDNQNENKVQELLQNGKDCGIAIPNGLQTEMMIEKSSNETIDDDTSPSQDDMPSLSRGISKQGSKRKCSKKKTTFCLTNQKRERKVSSSFHIGKSSTSARNVLEEKRATSIPDLSLLEGMYSTRIGPPISPRTDSLIKKRPAHGILKQSQSLDYRKIKSPPYSLDITDVKSKSMSIGPKRDMSCPERLSDICNAVVEEEEEEVKGQPHIDQYARVARNRDERSKVRAQGCRQVIQETLKSPMVERRAASLDESAQEDLNRLRNQDRKSSCPTASLIFQQKHTESISPPNYRKANSPNTLSCANNRKVSSRVISPTLERHLRNLNSFWSQNRASVVINGPQDTPQSQVTQQEEKSQGTSRSNSFRSDSLLDDGKQKAVRSRSCSPSRNRQSSPALPINGHKSNTLPWDPLRSCNPSRINSTTTSTPTTSTSTTLARSASRSPCTSPRNSPRLSRKQGDAMPETPEYETAEPTMSPPAFSPPAFAPPPLPPTILTDHNPDYEEVDKGRPASANELASPTGQYGYMRQPSYVECARSVPASPVSTTPPSTSIKPVRAAPPPPSAKKKVDQQASETYETTPVSYV
ncbi:uncharacterized protein LOC129261188 [Lytechinus pictus]|uniref:uncharacterized protein LOC129261188 n=1 Tax=Lytechinus pictus TaxID=7653 RepID=UPI0030B9D59B